MLKRNNIIVFLFLLLIYQFKFEENRIEINKIPVKLDFSFEFELKSKENISLNKNSVTLCNVYRIDQKKTYCFFPKKKGSFIHGLDYGDYTSTFDLISHHKKGYLSQKQFNGHLLNRYDSQKPLFKITFHEVSQTRAMAKDMPADHIHIEMRLFNFSDIESSIFLSKIEVSGNYISLYSKGIAQGNEIRIGVIDTQRFELKLERLGLIDYFGGENFLHGLSDTFEDLGQGEIFKANVFKSNAKAKEPLKVYETPGLTSPLLATLKKGDALQYLETTDYSVMYNQTKTFFLKVRLSDRREGYILDAKAVDFLEK